MKQNRIGAVLWTMIFLGGGTFLFANELEHIQDLYFEGLSEKALRAYQELGEKKNSPEALLNAALMAQERGDPQTAIQLFEKEIDYKSFQKQRNTQLGWLYANVGQWDKLKNLIEKNKSKMSDDLLGQTLMARFKMHEADAISVLPDLQEMVSSLPKFTLGHFYLGLWLEQQNDPTSAQVEYERALKEDSHFIEVRPRLASLYENKSLINEAWAQYARLFAADSRNNSALQGMKRLAQRITKKPEEIVPPKKILSPTPVPPMRDRDKLPLLRVGIGTTSGGKPTRKEKLGFRTSTPFVFYDPETNKDLRDGTALATWEIRWNKKKYVAEMVNPEGQVVGTFSRTIGIRQKGEKPSTTILNSLTFAPDTSWGGMADKEVRGDVEIRVNRERRCLVVINHLSLEEYLYGVLAAEMPVHWPMEALKAQAVIARTQGIYRKGLHRKYGYDVCDEQHCQVYTGVAVESERVREAIDGTRGYTLTYNGRPAHTVFSSNCGGFTQSGSQVGWGNVAYWPHFYDGKNKQSQPHSLLELRKWLMESPKVYCQSSQYTWHPEFRWNRVVPATDIVSKLQRKRNVGTLQKIQILERNASGRVQKVRIVGSKNSVTLTKEHEIRKYLGLVSVRSTLFVMDTVYKNNIPDHFLFFGGGWGHGVGFCQSGAAGRAEEGQNFKQIMEAYFSGAVLTKL